MSDDPSWLTDAVEEALSVGLDLADAINKLEEARAAFDNAERYVHDLSRQVEDARSSVADLAIQLHQNGVTR